jgi:spore germination cell wall hydrolase CwlJ-like protein
MTLLALNRPLRSPLSWVALLGIAVIGGFAVVAVLTAPADMSPPARISLAGALPKPPVAAASAIPTVPAQVFESLTPDQAVALNAELPISGLPNPAAAPFKLANVTEFDRARAVTCLAEAVYYEAASQGDDGEAAVAQVVLNRVRNPVFPKTVCGVVFQGSNLPTGCQFTFTCDGSMARPPSADGWRRAKLIAERALGGYVQKSVGEATYYHANYVVPYWQPTVLKVAQIGAHIFYRWNGELGRPSAFNGSYAGVEPVVPIPPGIAAQDIPSMTEAPAAVASAAAHAAPDAEAKPAVKIVEMAAAPSIAPAIAPDVVPAPVNYFGGGDNARPQRLPTAGR